MNNLQDILNKLGDIAKQVTKFLPWLFACLLLGIYGFLMYRINTLNTAVPSATTSSIQTTSVPRISPALIKQLQSLQDNSTSVQSLFDQARNNPFQE